MLCKSKGKMCNSCCHYKNKRCTKAHWLDMISFAKGEKPKKSLWKSKLR